MQIIINNINRLTTQTKRYGLSDETELKHINFDLTGLKTMEYSMAYTPHTAHKYESSDVAH